MIREQLAGEKFKFSEEDIESCTDLYRKPEISPIDAEQVRKSTKEGVGVKLAGLKASHGVAEGRASVLSDFADGLGIKEGSLLVCSAASRAVIHVMPRLNALVSERGGTVAFASRYARDCGIPAVVGVEGATGAIKDGDIIRVDGTQGTVEIIRRA
ncbi:MAG: PEP-utilizing enzyme [Desulfatiglandales bacterium]